MSDENKLTFAVKKYLQKHPDFFVKNPELLTSLEVVDSKGKLADFTTHQMRALKKENSQLKMQLKQLITNAQQSETLMNRLFTILSELSLVGKEHFLSAFVDKVAEHFPSDYFKLLLAEELCHESVAHTDVLSANHKTHFANTIHQSTPLSGRLKSEQINSIFENGSDIKSAVVLPIGPQAIYGLMSFASKDQEKFHPHSSTDILQKLSQILASYFSQQGDSTQNNVTELNDVAVGD